MASINHDLNIIYFHIPKTGGTYIQTLLEEYYDFFSYNFLVRSDFHIFNEFNKKKTENYKDYLKVTPFSNRLFGVNNYYSGSKELIDATTLGEQKWNDSLKFTFVRDPYSRFISAFNFILSIPTISENLVDNDNYEKFENIDYFIDNKDELSDIAYNHVFLSQYDQIIDKDGINNINFIGKQENLEEDLSNILLKAGFNEIKHIERRNINKNRIDYNYYKTYYTEYSFNFVNKHFEKDFSEFNYKKYDKFDDFMFTEL
jgi:hypothetical protein